MILAVARTHFAKLKRDRAALVLSFVLPVVFFTVFATLFGGGSSSRTATRRIALVVVDEDGSPNSRRFVQALKREQGLRIVEETEDGGRKTPPADAAAAEAMVRAGDVPLALVVPKGFGASPIGFGPQTGGPTLRILADTSDPIAPEVLSGLLQKVAMTAMPDVMAERGIEQVDRWGGDLTPEQKAALQRNVDLLKRETGAGPASGGAGLVNVEVRDVLGEKKKSPGVAVTAAGLGVMFLLFSAAGAGGALIEEVESGTLDRVLSTRVTMGQLLSGKLLYLTTVAVAQLTVMFVWGEIFFGLELHRHVPGFLVMAVVTAVAASAFGLVLAALSRTRMQLVALSNMVILVMSALGGSMYPRFLMSEGVQKAGLVTLNAWAIDGFMKVFWREEPLSALWPQVLFLAVAAAVLFGLARRLARRWEAV